MQPQQSNTKHNPHLLSERRGLDQRHEQADERLGLVHDPPVDVFVEQAAAQTGHGPATTNSILRANLTRKKKKSEKKDQTRL